jgi:hypothetical protein
MINKIEACGIIYERKCKKMNWCVIAVWTICDQLHRLQSLEVGLLGKTRHVAYLDRFEELNRKEEEGPMPTNNMPKTQSQQKFLFSRKVKCSA